MGGGTGRFIPSTPGCSTSDSGSSPENGSGDHVQIPGFKENWRLKPSITAELHQRKSRFIKVEPCSKSSFLVNAQYISALCRYLEKILKFFSLVCP